MRPPPATMVWWRFKSPNPTVYNFGYCTYVQANMIRMGYHNGDNMNGPVVDPYEIEWKPYHAHNQ